jgi:NAD(P)H-flavin reductase
MMSIVRTALDRLAPRPTYLYFGARAETDAYVGDELTSLVSDYPHIHAHVVLSVPSGASQCRVGFVHQALESDFDDLSGAKVYAAGPPPMISAVTEFAAARGLQADDVHSDPFVPSSQDDGRRQRSLLHAISNLLEKAGATLGGAASLAASRR